MTAAGAMSVEAIAQAKQQLEAIVETSRCLDNEIDRRDYNAARVSADRLYGSLDQLDAMAATAHTDDDRASLAELREDLCDQWVRADSVIRVYETRLGSVQSEALDEPAAPADRIGAELARLRAERYADTVAVAALLHWARKGHNAGRLVVGAGTSTALANLERRFTPRIDVINADRGARGRLTWNADGGDGWRAEW